MRSGDCEFLRVFHITRRRAVRLALLLALAAASPAAAQDQGLDALLLTGALDHAPDDVQASTVALYRLPLAIPLRSAKDNRVGVRVTFPVSLSSVRLESVSDIQPFVRKLGLAAIVPGIEFQILAGDRMRLRPFAEVGIGKAEGRKTEALYGAGLRVRVDQPARTLQLTFGGSAMYRKRGTGGNEDAGHSMIEAAVDAQLPIGFSIGTKQARGGLYAIGRGFDGLELTREGHNPIVLSGQFEAGFSFSTAPSLKIWKITLPWLAVGYQSGEVISGVRMYVAFPF